MNKDHDLGQSTKSYRQLKVSNSFRVQFSIKHEIIEFSVYKVSES